MNSKTIAKTIEFVWLAICMLVITAACCRACNVQAQTQNQIKWMIEKSAIKHGIDPKLAVAIATIESRLNPNAIGSIGEIGLFQLRPEQHPVVKGNIGNNIETAMNYLVQLKFQCKAYGTAYFVCFNYGPTRRLRYPKLFPYYKKVIAQLKQNIRLAKTFASNQ